MNVQDGPQKIPSSQIQSCQERVQVHHLATAMERVVGDAGADLSAGPSGGIEVRDEVTGREGRKGAKDAKELERLFLVFFASFASLAPLR